MGGNEEKLRRNVKIDVRSVEDGRVTKIAGKRTRGHVKTKDKIGRLDDSWVKRRKDVTFGSRAVEAHPGLSGLGAIALREGEVENHFNNLNIESEVEDVYSHSLNSTGGGDGFIIDKETQRVLEGKPARGSTREEYEAEDARKTHLQMNRNENYYWGKKFATDVDEWHDDMSYTKLWAHYKNKNYTPSLPLFNTIMAGLGKRGESRKVFRVYDNMLRTTNLRPDSRTFTALFTSLAKDDGQHVQKALYTESKMRNEGVKPTIHTYNALLSALRKGKYVTGVQAVFERMKQDMIEPDIITYTEIMDTCMRSDGVGSALALIQQLKDEGVEQDILIYNVLLKLCRDSPRDQDRAEAITIFRNILDSGVQQIQPTIHTFDIMLGVYVKGKRNEEDLFKLMRRQGIQPDRWFYNSLVLLYSNREQVTACKDAYKRMRDAGFPPDPTTFTGLFQSTENMIDLYAYIEDARLNLKGGDKVGLVKMSSEMLKACYRHRGFDAVLHAIDCMLDLKVEFRTFHIDQINMCVTSNERKKKKSPDFIPKLRKALEPIKESEFVYKLYKRLAKWEVDQNAESEKKNAKNVTGFVKKKMKIINM
eukprot:CFRG7784T1